MIFEPTIIGVENLATEETIIRLMVLSIKIISKRLVAAPVLNEKNAKILTQTKPTAKCLNSFL